MIEEEKIKKTIENFKVYSHGETTKLLLEYIKLKNQIQNYKNDRVIYVVVGPSGSGKSTLIANMYANNVFNNEEGNFVPFINRAYYNKTVVEKDKVYLQDEISLKKKLCHEGKSFLMEVAEFNDDYFHFIKDIKENNEEYGNYKICMIYLTKRNPRDNVRCIQNRKKQGGHGRSTRELNVNYVAEQYKTDGENLRKAIPICDSVFIVNNKTQRCSQTEKPTIIMQKKLSGEIVLSPLQKYQIQFARIINPTIKKVIEQPLKKLLSLIKGKSQTSGVYHEQEYVVVDDSIIESIIGNPHQLTMQKK